MTFNERGLLRLMKSEYKGYGYTVAQTGSGMVISGAMWGVAIMDHLVPNEVKSLIVLHTGKLPAEGEAIFCQKDNVTSKIYEMAVARITDLKTARVNGTPHRVAPTRLMFDRFRLWQRTNDLKVVLIDPEYQQILDYSDRDAYLVGGALFCENYAGIVWVERELRQEEDEALLKHLEMMQWVSLSEGCE